MGVNNKQRRAAKRKKRAGSGSSGPASSGSGAGGCGCGCGAGWTEADETYAASAFLHDAIGKIADDLPLAGSVAGLLFESQSAATRRHVQSELPALLSDLVERVVKRGWSPVDLAQIVRREFDEHHAAEVVMLVTDLTRAVPATKVSAEWLASLQEAGPTAPLALGEPAGLTRALAVAGLLMTLPSLAPVVSPPGAVLRAGAAPVDPTEAKLLARVRALLGKAESTEFPEEAEALSAKAQELITRHSLDRLLATSQHPEQQREVITSRLWINKPYTRAKGHLIQAVARANRCESVLSEHLGFSTLMGTRQDVAAIELLVTSLLVQANAAMLGHGRQVDRSGTSRTTSFRKAFLLSYAQRIGERLAAATDQATRDSGRAGELVPVLRDHEQQVSAAIRKAFPGLVQKSATVSNHVGWQAGRSAADRAQLDPRERLTG